METYKEKLVLVWQLETENIISTWLLSVLFWSSLCHKATLIYITERWGRGTTEPHFPSEQEAKIKCDTDHTIHRVYDWACDICCYIRSDLGFWATHAVMADLAGSHWPFYARSRASQLCQAKMKPQIRATYQIVGQCHTSVAKILYYCICSVNELQTQWLMHSHLHQHMYLLHGEF